MGSGNKVSGKLVPRRVRKRAERAATNASPRGGEKHKKAHTTTEEGEDNEDTEEVFGVPRVMAEEQRDTLGMLTQALVQVAERMAAVEACDEERLALEREMVEIQRVHLAMARKSEDLWKMGTLRWSPFIYLCKEKEKAVKTEVEEVGEEVDNDNKDVQGEKE
ncbi:hypothetical protein SCLCIDRAFT_26628 [Scleroderma citrinum Foug A]|uniref:Uncharacterized protein n=1 Tax=Scleroderma citrinum Foug A TaxID=1036808 RepID=A0A0C3DW21_9AGAM|nr:hypothetical protein SCLCIDRAFT_26628 [Scleroderma citrinum Foug A]